MAARFNALHRRPAGRRRRRRARTRTACADGDITIVHCPGAFEIPQLAKRLVETGAYDAVVCLGCVIRGATTHYDYVAGHAAYGIAEVAMSAKIPVIFGVLTTENIEQAVERAGTKAGNKGIDAALAALEMASLYRSSTARNGDVDSDRDAPPRA